MRLRYGGLWMRIWPQILPPPGEPGADGKTPVYGVDYGTPEQIAGIAQSAAEILQPDVDKLKDDIDYLGNTGETKAGAGKVLTATDDGTEWKTPTGGGGGTGSELILLNSVTLTESVVSADILDLGADYNLSDFRQIIIYYSAIGDDSNAGAATVLIKSSIGNLTPLDFTKLPKSSAGFRWGTIIIDALNANFMLITGFASENEYTSAMPLMWRSTTSSNFSGKKLSITSRTSGHLIGRGTIIEVYGVKK